MLWRGREGGRREGGREGGRDGEGLRVKGGIKGQRREKKDNNCCRMLRNLCLTCTMSGVHESRRTERTLDMLVPVRLLWIPAQLMQINTPKLMEAHWGSA